LPIKGGTVGPKLIGIVVGVVMKVETGRLWTKIHHTSTQELKKYNRRCKQKRCLILKRNLRLNYSGQVQQIMKCHYRSDHSFYNVTVLSNPRDAVSFVKLSDGQIRRAGTYLFFLIFSWYEATRH